jgi:F420-non-reducing hydrogenase large subunit
VHHTLANHWARVIEMIHAAERMVELVNDPEITSTDIRNIPTRPRRQPASAWWKRRAARCSITTRPTSGADHESKPDRGHAEQRARIAMSVEKAAKGLIKKGVGERWVAVEPDRDGVPRLRSM